ncbi:tetratricopeptide repeat-containing sensor histidine kinase [Flavobacterium agrisoli]|uniref:histidine kinase n=1 Tax=Flavobacterium agrisoli TaxID=2793066 RepID=A0A934UK03_9FLAO|nr:tetratricopeptide repeat protein [Flavobacterium agrisoli]MBK0370079.1 tetratricopeptide repeat protein [Flavobacterium agrisoli]
MSCNRDFEKKSQLAVYKQKANILREKAIRNFSSGQHGKAFIYFNKAKEFYTISKDTANVEYCLYQMAVSQQTSGDYIGSEETLTELLGFDNINYQSPINNLLGIIAKEHGYYNDAIKYYKLTLKNAKNEVDRISPLNNMATVYIEMNRPSKAIQILESILKSEVLNDSVLILKKAKILDNLGYAYFKAGNRKEAILNLDLALEIRKESIHYGYDLIESYLHLAKFYQVENLQKSNGWALKAYSNATVYKSVDERLESLSILMENGTQSIYVKQYLNLSDSIQKVRNSAKNQFAKIRYDSQKEKEENQQLKLEKASNLLKLERAKTERLGFAIGTVLFGLGLFYIIVYFKRRNQKEKVKAIYETETRISKQLHDELANDVFQTISYVQLSGEINLQEDKLLNKLDHIYNKARNLSREMADIDTGSSFKMELKQMIGDYGNESINVVFRDNDQINWDGVNKRSKITIYRVLQELMVNMKKHSNAEIVVVGFKDNGKLIEIFYSDNGKGIANKEPKKNGLKNVENRIQTVKGTFTFGSNEGKGFRFNFSIPK